MPQMLYDANGNPIIDPYQGTTANNRLPPEAPGGLAGSQQQNMSPQPQTPPNVAPNAASSGGGTGTGSGGGLQGLLRLFQNNPQAVQATPQATQQEALAQGTQVGPANPPPDQNTNPVGAVGSTGPSQGQRNTASAIGSVGSGLGQLGQDIAKSVPSWHMMQSAIPDPSQYRNQEQQYQYDFQRHPIV